MKNSHNLSSESTDSTMFNLKALIDTSILPANVFSLRDEPFLTFIRDEAGDDAAAVFEVQGINSVKSLLMTPDVFSFVRMKCNTLEDMKKQIAYRQDDDSYVIKAGVRGNVDYIIDLLRQKCIDDVKTKNLSASIKSSQAPPVSARVSSGLSQPVVSTQFVLQDTSSAANSTIDWSTDDHRVSLIDSVSQWLERNKKELNFDGPSLIEGQHYHVSIVNDSLGGFVGKIKCSCGTVVTLIKNREKFQLSNFYRHIADRRNGKLCDMVQKLGVPSTRSPSYTHTTDDQANLPLSSLDVSPAAGGLASHSTVRASSPCGAERSDSQAPSSVPIDENDLCATATPIPLPSTRVGKRKEISATQSQSTTRRTQKRVRRK